MNGVPSPGGLRAIRLPGRNRHARRGIIPPVERIGSHWPAALIVALGLVLILVLALLGGDLGSISWAGAGIGVLAGIAIGAVNRRRARGRPK